MAPSTHGSRRPRRPVRSAVTRWRERGGSLVRALPRNRLGVVGSVMLALAILTAVLAPWIAPYDPEASIEVSIEDIYARPTSAHWLGTDDGGKDVFSAFIYGSRVSLVVGFAASLISMIVGGVVGLVAGLYGGVRGDMLLR